jgi:acyl-CoA reductase-like NAD-dependent aldehyde dehydrogenase
MLKSELDQWLKIGDPMDSNTTLGPLVDMKSKINLTKQV